MGPANEVNEATVDIRKYLHEVKDKEKAIKCMSNGSMKHHLKNG